MTMNTLNAESEVVSLIHGLEDHSDYLKVNIDDFSDLALFIADKNMEGFKELLDDKIVNPKSFSSSLLNFTIHLAHKYQDKEYLKYFDLLLNYGAILHENADGVIFSVIKWNESGMVFDHLIGAYNKQDEKNLKYSVITKMRLDEILVKRLMFSAITETNIQVLEILLKRYEDLFIRNLKEDSFVQNLVKASQIGEHKYDSQLLSLLLSQSHTRQKLLIPNSPFISYLKKQSKIKESNEDFVKRLEIYYAL